MDVWSWISDLPSSDEWDLVNSSEMITFQLAPSTGDSARSIQLSAERSLGSSTDGLLITFSVRFVGFGSIASDEPVWSSDTCPLSSEKPFLSLVLQLLEEIVSRSPNAHGSSSFPGSELRKLKPEPVSWILDSHSPESFSTFFDLVLLTRLFWLCVFDAPSEIGSFYFQSVLTPNLEALSCKYAPVLKNFFISVGTDVELSFMRTFGYISAKWMILRELEFGLQSLAPLPTDLGFSYAMESHGLWILKGYSPVKSMMRCVQCHEEKRPLSTTESFLKYALAHQQLEAVIQLEYTVRYFDNYIQVNARVDNLRFHVVKLGFRSGRSRSLEEKHFPSRVRVWVGPDVGSGYVGGLTLGRSTDNVEREMEEQKTLKGKSGNSKVVSKVKATARIATRTKMKNWRWDQDVEGNAAVFDAILCDNTSGAEVATWKASTGGGRGLVGRYAGCSRPFTKSGGVVFAGDEYGQAVGWRLSKEMEGSVLTWRLGGCVWLSYLPNDVNSPYQETRCVEWSDEVDLPLIPFKN